MTAETSDRPAALDDVPGWFPALDQRVFRWILERQDRLGQAGDLLELGVYLGKSAILTGRHLRPGETYTVCDLFDSDAPDMANAQEMRTSYRSLTRVGFEKNYLAFHERLPEIIQAPTSAVLDHVQPGSCRFVHIDASHLYEHVRGDLTAARTVLGDDGIAVCDDYRSPHTPGVSAAVWEAVANNGLSAVWITPQKLYGTWGDPAPIRRDLIEWIESSDDLWHELQHVSGAPLVRLGSRGSKSQESELKALRSALTREKRHARRAETSLQQKKEELAAVRGSMSFRAGRILTAAPRALRDTVRRDQ
jgi:predicted O-methyltransferase YrrM